MGNGFQPDPYASLQENLAKRKSDFLKTITARDPSMNSAQIRGFLKKCGPPTRTFTRQEKRNARNRQAAYQSVWTDDPALRVPFVEEDKDRLSADSIYLVIARLQVEGRLFSPPFPVADDLPDLNAVATFPVILRTADVLTLCKDAQDSIGQEQIEESIWDAIALVRDHKGQQLFDQSVIDKILDALEGGPPTNLSPDELVVPWLAQFKSGTPQSFGPILGLTARQQIGGDVAAQLFSALASLIGGDVAVMLIETALGDGRTVPSSTPIGLIGDENDDLTLADDVWGLFEFLFWLAGLPRKPLRQALADLANWWFPAPPEPNEYITALPSPPLRLQDSGGTPTLDNTNIFLEIWANRVQVPQGFIWPDYDVEGVYWWRAIVLPVCIQHIFALADTSDFWTVALVRFASMFQLYNPDPTQRDVRVPEWVSTDIQLALLGFKYWLDEAPATGNDGGEMTFWSENHQIQFATSEYLAGTIFSDQIFAYDPQNPKTAADRVSRGKQRVSDWLDRRLRFGFSEWNAPGYYDYDLPALFALVDFAPDVAIRVNAQMVLDTVVFDLARLCCRGSFGVSAGRAYWEHKCYGWEQSVGDVIEVLFGTRGDIMESANLSAVSLATSTYQVPDALLAIAIDRSIVDRQSPLVDQVRVSILPSDAKENGVDPTQGDNLIFWWGNMDYFGSETLDLTDQFSGSHDNLKLTPPFSILYKFIHLKDDEWHQVLYDTLEVGAGVVTLSAAMLVTALPFPLDLLAIPVVPVGIVAGAGMILEGVVHLLGDIVTLIGKGLHAIAHFLGLAHDDPPKIPESAVVEAFHKLLYAFNDGNVLQRANIYTYSNGDAALSSVQNHLAGMMAFQKHPWQATLGTEACLWTTAPFRPPGTGSKARAWLDFFADYLTLRTVEGFEAIGLSTVDAGSIFGHDGFTYWNGSVALPFVVQYRSAAIIAYQLNDIEKRLSDPATHVWIPKGMFDDEPELVDAHDGTWVFAKKDTIDPVSGDRLGSGYVALFSARKLSWATSYPWADDPDTGRLARELLAEGDANIFVCLVGNEAKFRSFDAFKQQTTSAYLQPNLSNLACSFDIPGEVASAGATPRLELIYDDVTGRFAGKDLELGSFLRWDNPYANIAWGARKYTIAHTPTGLSLTHDLDHIVRTFNQQPEPQEQQQSLPRRLWDDSLTPDRRFQSPPAQTPVGAQMRRELFQKGQS